jgi:chemotaxis protein methyltransferase CheR
MLERAIVKRLATHGLDDLADYWTLIDNAFSVELNSLIQLLAAKEALFFREMHQFEVLRERILPELLRARKYRNGVERVQEAPHTARSEPLRLWSASCATGEEAYSLAIMLLEFQREHRSLEAEIIGTDVDASALEIARRARYSEQALQLVPSNLRRRYFSFDGQAYSIVPEVAQLVTFQVHNLTKDHYPPELTHLDVIFCRNITAYFANETRQVLNAQLSDSLRDGGYLFVASTETMGHNQGHLELLSVDNTLLLRKGLPTSEALLPPPLSPVAVQPAKKGTAVSSLAPEHKADTSLDVSTPSLLQQAQTAFQRQDYDAALHELERMSNDQPALLEAYCLRAAALLQKKRLTEAESACQYVLAHDPWHIDAHLLLGITLFHRGQADVAIQSFKTAIYLQPEHQDARFYLAESYRVLNMTDKAHQEYKNTLNILTHRPPSAQSLSLSGLTNDMLRQACEFHLNKLD